MNGYEKGGRVMAEGPTSIDIESARDAAAWRSRKYTVHRPLLAGAGTSKPRGPWYYYATMGSLRAATTGLCEGKLP